MAKQRSRRAKAGDDDPDGYAAALVRNPAAVDRLMRVMGLEAVYRAPRTSALHPKHRICPYLLRGLAIEHPDHVWCADIIHIPVQRNFLYQMAIMDWASRYMLARRLSNTLDAGFCTEALDEALIWHGPPQIPTGATAATTKSIQRDCLDMNFNRYTPIAQPPVCHKPEPHHSLHSNKLQTHNHIPIK